MIAGVRTVCWMLNRMLCCTTDLYPTLRSEETYQSKRSIVIAREFSTRMTIIRKVPIPQRFIKCKMVSTLNVACRIRVHNPMFLAGAACFWIFSRSDSIGLLVLVEPYTNRRNFPIQLSQEFYVKYFARVAKCCRQLLEHMFHRARTTIKR